MDDKNLNLAELIKNFADDAKCRAYLEGLRWPKGIECPHCQSKKVYRIVKRDQLLCASCEYQFSVTVDGILHDTHLPLWKWFLATMLLCESKKGMSACQIQTALGISYKTAWYLCHRIRKAMQEIEPRALLGGTVEIDETYVAGTKRRWRPKVNPQVVIGIRQRNGDLRLIRAKDAKSKTVREIINANVGGHVEIILTDESAFTLLKRGIVGTWHKVSAKHLPAYLDEMCFRINNRKNPFLFRDTIIKLLQTPNLEYKELTAQSQEPAA